METTHDEVSNTSIAFTLIEPYDCVLNDISYYGVCDEYDELVLNDNEDITNFASRLYVLARKLMSRGYPSIMHKHVVKKLIRSLPLSRFGILAFARVDEFVNMPYDEVVAILSSLEEEDRKSTRLNSSHANISYAVFCLKKKKNH